MTQTTVDPITITYATATADEEIIQLAADYIAQWPEARMYELLMTLWRLGVDVFDLVPCALGEID